MKTLSFDATEVKTSVRTSNCLSVEIETMYLNEVLDNFSTDEIMANYSDLDTLYEVLKELFE